MLDICLKVNINPKVFLGQESFLKIEYYYISLRTYQLMIVYTGIPLLDQIEYFQSSSILLYGLNTKSERNCIRYRWLKKKKEKKMILFYILQEDDLYPGTTKVVRFCLYSMKIQRTVISFIYPAIPHRSCKYG